jgi:archaellum component FlaF (FlaF/FlaG flagellin family)
MGGIWSQQIYYSKARDMARFGLLNLNKGIWNADTLMKDSVYFKSMTHSSQTLNYSYGYLFWLNGKSSFMAPQSQLVFPGTLMSNAPSDMYCALGKNDQKIYIVPGQNIVIVRQGNTAGGFNLAASSFDNTLWDYINKLTCITSINEKENEVTYLSYPNPVKTDLTIENEKQKIEKISIYDVLGNTLFTNSKLQYEAKINIDFSSFSKGVYVLEIENKKHSVLRKKIIKD